MEPSQHRAKRKRLSLNQKVTLALATASVLVSVVSLIVAAMTLQTARDTTEIKIAIGRLAELAKQAGRQADAVSGQLNEMKSQTGHLANEARAAQGQLENAKAQTKAISEQTMAIKNTATAAIRSSEAQTRAANVSERAQLPRVALSSMSIDGIGGEPDKNGIVEATLNWEFFNNGGGAFVQKPSTFAVQIAEKTPRKPAPNAYSLWGGNSFSVGPGKDLVFTVPPKIWLSKDQIAGLKTQHLFAFVSGILNYQDSLGNKHAFCFLYRLVFRDGALRDPFPVEAPEYQCSD